MSRRIPTIILSHWQHGMEGLTYSSDLFYAEIEQAISQHNLYDVRVERVNLREGGILSARREYLQIRRGDYVFHVCGAPFGNTFFISSWLGYIESGFWAWLGGFPFVGFIVRWLIKRPTYYRIDSAQMFLTITHAAVTQALDSACFLRGTRMLTDAERTPVQRDFFTMIGRK